MTTIDTDYLVIGTGAAGMAFADTLLRHSDAHITLVDRRAEPGGHWNDAYPFVTLHQPSAFYGVNSIALGINRRDTVGPNAGLHELAGGAEVLGYFHRVMHEQLLPSGRVRWLPVSEFKGLEGDQAQVSSLLTGKCTTIGVRRKLVDASWFSPEVPATTPPAYRVAEGVRLVTPTQLTQCGAGAPPSGFCIVGAGKTAMDVALWLLGNGVDADAIRWVMPRDSWVVDRRTTQPGEDFFDDSVGGQLHQLTALAEASSIDDLFMRLEASGQLLRIDRGHTPRMFHYATLSEGEVRLLRQVRQVIRRGRVLAIEPEGLVLAEGREAMPPTTLYIDCSASAVKVRRSKPIFQPGRIAPQLVRAPLVSFSAALCAWVEAHHDDDALKNRLCTPVPFPRDLAGYVPAVLTNLANQQAWGQDKALRQWMRDSRLDGFGRMTAEVVARNDAPKLAVLAALREQAVAAVANGRRLLAKTTSPET